MAFQPQPVHEIITYTGILDALDTTVIMPLDNSSGAIVNVSGTWVGTILFDGSNDGFITFQNASVFTPPAGVITTGITTSSYYRFVAVSGFTQVRARMSSYTSGSATVVLSSSIGAGLASTVSVNYDSMLGTSKLTGNTDGTKIGNVSDRLKVDAQITSIPTTPNEFAIPFWAYCKNSGSEVMSVNGSSVNVNFDYSPSSGQFPQYITDIRFLIYDNGSPLLTTFGIITALTNGLQILVKTNGTEYELANIKSNMDSLMVFINSSTEGQGSFVPDDAYVGTLHLEHPIVLNSTSDYVRFKVRDNLTAIDILRAAVHGFRI